MMTSAAADLSTIAAVDLATTAAFDLGGVPDLAGADDLQTGADLLPASDGSGVSGCGCRVGASAG
jgi:hypothetical protein